MKYFFSFLWVFVAFGLIGPFIGVLFIIASGENPSTRDEFGFAIFFGYMFGIIPALFSGIINWFIIFLHYLAKNQNYFWPGALISGALTGITIWLLTGRHHDFSWFLFFMCMIATIACAFISSNRAWHHLSNS